MMRGCFTRHGIPKDPASYLTLSFTFIATNCDSQILPQGLLSSRRTVAT